MKPRQKKKKEQTPGVPEAPLTRTGKSTRASELASDLSCYKVSVAS